VDIQKTFLLRLRDFASISINKDSTMVQKLNEIGLQKVIIVAIGSGSIHTEILQDYLKLLVIFLKSNFTSESVISFCTFLTSTLPLSSISKIDSN
jgi:hypothetical protein